jgi:hypothetical protein
MRKTEMPLLPLSRRQSQTADCGRFAHPYEIIRKFRSESLESCVKARLKFL